MSEPYHHGGLRAALVAAALELLSRGGAEELSLRAVARAAGVSAMAPYRHFPDKAALLAAVAARGFEGLRDALLAAEAGAPADGLVAQAGAYVGFARENPALFRLMFGPAGGGADLALLASGRTAYAVLADRVAADFPGGPVEALTLGCWAMVHGLASLLLDGKLAAEHAAPEALAREVAAAMLDGRMDRGRPGA